VERAIANQEIEATAREISGVNAGDAGGGHFGGNCVVRPFPASAVDGNAGGCKTVESSEREAFGFAIIPTEPSEDADAFPDFLINAETEAVFQSPGAAGRGDGPESR
jgi:hypothetical protein